jgi:hypothetical protein
MHRGGKSSGFPQVSSMPSIRRFKGNSTSMTTRSAQRSYEIENLRKISSTASPFSARKNFTPISVSTIHSNEVNDDDESRDELRGFFTTFLILSKTKIYSNKFPIRRD